MATGFATAPPAHATHVVVRPDGSGDAPNFQAGVDCLLGIACDPPPDTLVVEAGAYHEDVVFDCAHGQPQGAIVCPAGPTATTVRSVARQTGAYGSLEVHGLAVTGGVDLGGPGSGFAWIDCRFGADVTSRGTNLITHRFRRCEFRGLLDLAGAGIVDSSSFLGGRAALKLTLFNLQVNDCLFDGAAGPAVVATPGDQSAVCFTGCVFRSVDRGIVIDPAPVYFGDQVVVSRCRFEDVRDAALSYDASVSASTAWLAVAVDHSRFERCGAGVRLRFDRGVQLAMVADTLLDIGGIGVEADAQLRACRLDSLVVRGAAAHGVVLRSGDASNAWPLAVTASILETNGGDGLRIEQAIGAYHRRPRVEGCRLAGNGGAGARLLDAATLVDNVVVGNAGAGLDLTVAGAEPDSVLGNTLVGNADGVALASPPDHPSPAAFVEHNLAAGNRGSGFAIASGFAGSVLHNDLWMNSGGDDVAGDSSLNLSADPLFCAGSNDYGVRADSPCAASGPFGRIGAPVAGCEAPLAVGPRSAATAALSLGGVAPNPLASGRTVTVSFTLPVPGAAALDVLDAGGRRVLRRDLGAPGAGDHRVQLRLEGGLSPGVYWVRIVQGPRFAAAKVAVLP